MSSWKVRNEGARDEFFEGNEEGRNEFLEGNPSILCKSRIESYLFFLSKKAK
jgi:hypothetical protein